MSFCDFLRNYADRPAEYWKTHAPTVTAEGDIKVEEVKSLPQKEKIAAFFQAQIAEHGAQIQNDDALSLDAFKISSHLSEGWKVDFLSVFQWVIPSFDIYGEDGKVELSQKNHFAICSLLADKKGNFFQACFGSGFKESKEKLVRLPFSSEAIKIYLDSLQTPLKKVPSHHLFAIACIAHYLDDNSQVESSVNLLMDRFRKSAFLDKDLASLLLQLPSGCMDRVDLSRAFFAIAGVKIRDLAPADILSFFERLAESVKDLRFLDLSYTRLPDSKEFFSKLSKLFPNVEYLVMRHMPFERCAIPERWKETLEVVDLSYCSNLGEIVGLDDSSSLKELIIDWTQIKMVPKGCVNLQIFHAKYATQLRDISGLNNLKELKSLSLGGTSLKQIPAGVTLEEFSLEGTSLSKEEVKDISEKLLDLRKNPYHERWSSTGF